MQDRPKFSDHHSRPTIACSTLPRAIDERAGADRTGFRADHRRRSVDRRHPWTILRRSAIRASGVHRGAIRTARRGRLGVSAARNLGLAGGARRYRRVFSIPTMSTVRTIVASHLAAYADKPDIICVVCSTLIACSTNGQQGIAGPGRHATAGASSNGRCRHRSVSDLRRARPRCGATDAIAIGGFNAAISLAEDREMTGAPGAARRHPADLGRAVGEVAGRRTGCRIWVRKPGRSI